MRNRIITAGLFTATLLCSAAIAQDVPLATAGEQEEVAITVYNDGLGLVRDVRSVVLPGGLFRLQWSDVASQINTQSVSLVDLTDADGISILEQNYQYDLVDQQKLIQKYLGKQVEIRIWDDTTDTYVTKRATLLAPDVVQIDGKIYPGLPGSLVLPELPGGLISVPTLEWQLQAQAAASHQVAMSYLTGGMGWQADYVAVVNDKDTALDINGWTTITNNSGATYNNATLKLVAGDVNRVQPEYDDMYLAREKHGRKEVAANGGGFEEKSFFEYHLYTLGRPTTLKNNEQKQVALFDAVGVPSHKKYVFEPGGDYWWGNMSESQKVDIQVKMEFRNAKEHGLGMPLPKGIVRVYKADSDGTLQFIGEDRIDHTPKDEDLRLVMGNAFDIVGERIVTDRRKINSDTWEYDIKVKLRNHKTETVTVSVFDKVTYGDWTVTKHSGGDYTKKDASTLEFSVPAPPDVEVALYYTIRREY